MHSPLPWMGGKFYSADKIISEFPSATLYDSYVDLFGGAGHVLLARPIVSRHVELYNDINNNLVNFWLVCRDNGTELEDRLASLPYSRGLYYQYYQDIYVNDLALEPLERATRWFYIVRSSFNGRDRETSPIGWCASMQKKNAYSFHSAVSFLPILQQRLKYVLIDNRDFRKVLKAHNKPRTLFYCDPPYIGTEHYYQGNFSHDDHQELAFLLNSSPSYIALSYYPHPLIDQWYPSAKWRRVEWDVPKHAQRSCDTHDYATELLLCNYSNQRSLWE